MPATNYLFDTRELKFVVKEWLDSEKLLACDEYKDYYSVDDFDAFIDVAYKIARDMVSPANGDADTLGARFKDGHVLLPESLKKAYYTIRDAGMGPSAFNYKEAGHIPRLFSACQNEILTAAAPCMILYWVTGGSAADVIEAYGDEALKARVLPNMFTGKWGGTMNLTEPGAGSDLGATATKAYPTDTPGLYKMKGTKCFITSGDTDLWDNIIHLVLARTEGAREGTAGISLFAVPKNRFDEKGNITEWNDVTTVGIEHKMGLHGSATCTLSYGENNDCYGWLIGKAPGPDGKGKGLAQMFMMMNESRLSTGLMALSCAEEAFYNAREYAKIRIQGKKITDPKGPRVPIIEHEDVKYMLLHQKACTEAMRALLLKTYWYTDMALASTDSEARKYYDDMFMINNPLCKAYVSETAWSLCGEAIQCYGGYGFIEEYPVAQLTRDAKIYSIWEGTTFIQSMDLVGRKFNMDGGKPFQKWMDEISQFIGNHQEDKNFTDEVKMLSVAQGSFSHILKLLKDKLTEGKISYQGLWANRIMFAMSMVYCGMLLLDQGILAQKKLDELRGDSFDTNFYKGKIASARFYIMNEVPKIFSIEETFDSSDSSVLDLKSEYLG
ncbi:MAG TPA: acyl-CoA dehydrogenase [Syntrophomonadaceae bacterium]|nr:acyl-CoA dehydrogenase [Syntrophomonadaceae bacterium]